MSTKFKVDLLDQATFTITEKFWFFVSKLEIEELDLIVEGDSFLIAIASIL